MVETDADADKAGRGGPKDRKPDGEGIKAERERNEKKGVYYKRDESWVKY
jgi:hypothetical protein